MKHEYIDAELQAAIDLAVEKYLLNTVCALPETYREKWAGKRSARLDLIKAALAALPEPEPPSVDWKASYEQMHSQAKHYLQLLRDWQTRAEKAEAELAVKTEQWETQRIPLEQLFQKLNAMADGPQLSQLRPLAEAGEVPEGCVRVTAFYVGGEWIIDSKGMHPGDTHFADIRLPAPEPMSTKPISLPTPNEAISLRDWLAGQALAGSDISTVMAEALKAGATSDEFSQILSMSVYKIADAMIKAREVKP